MAFINKDCKNLSRREIFEELKEILDKIIELANKTNFDDLIYYLKVDTSMKR